jgi:hypothetical protein
LVDGNCGIADFKRKLFWVFPKNAKNQELKHVFTEKFCKAKTLVKDPLQL